jgi:uncharacterized protein DUF2569
MDESQVERFAAGYRQMRDEQLLALLADSGSLTDTAHAALLRVISARPSIPADEVERAKAGAIAAKEGAELQSGERPKLGGWLAFLIFGLCTVPLRTAGTFWTAISDAEKEAPVLLEMGTWHIYKYVAIALCISVLVVSIIAIHAILAGKTNAHLQRVIAILWYISLGVFSIDLVASGVLFGFENVAAIFEDSETITQLIISTVITILWTGYLTMSEHCKRRYPVEANRTILGRT